MQENIQKREDVGTWNNRHPEIWGGMECTVNRVGDVYLDQLEKCGHFTRNNDFHLIADLGIKRLRFPILWERHEPVKGMTINWTTTDAGLKDLQDLSLSPIAGLVHHGSGPSFTSLRRHTFAPGLARFAAKVARRYPWIEYYTPVNEPLTTARFSGLYGLWYPHGRSDFSFCNTLLNQLKAVVLSMKEIRKVNNQAKLIQTEDLGKTYSVPSLQCQADFENCRRWLTFDILCGKFDHHHPLWKFFTDSGIHEKDLTFFLDNPCPPSTLGLNYYVTSERFLDDRLAYYPRHMHQGNKIRRYVDTEAVRVDHGQKSGLEVLLKEVLRRYDIPLAITEAHLNCTREEQMRWFKEIWDICVSVNNEHGKIEGVTAWSLFGAFGWNKLVTTVDGEYEPGVFDLRGGAPRPTAMARLIKSLSTTNDYQHPLLAQKGWWHRYDRFSVKPSTIALHKTDSTKNCPVMILVSDEELSRTFTDICRWRGIRYHLHIDDQEGPFSRSSFTTAVNRCAPWAVIDARTVVHHDADPLLVPAICHEQSIRLMAFTDSGMRQAILGANASALLIDAGDLLKEGIPESFVYYIKKEDRQHPVEGPLLSVTCVRDLIQICIDLMIDDEQGIWNVACEKKYLMPTYMEHSRLSS